MKVLKPSVARYIGIMENKILDELKANIRKYDLIEFMVTGGTEKFSFDIEKSIVQRNIQQINNSENNSDYKFKEIRDELNNLKEQSINTMISNSKTDNSGNDYRKQQ